ncbi:hypothetical protein CERSUDRAFT_57022 [Gelatoporia subvermispora B]|uniref:RecQ-mediated genome instability protein 1 n=1 Tax=Ceriporiopsis subvermispora (strain B) TaxID=914234 RepID=M2R3P9_CERS8|nr:hypothetical protein CERSUDRAFT_57022 [Gelatoporia subvermispora B]
MPAPAGVTNWLIQQYPKPRIDPQWLDECYAWIEGDLNLDPTTQLEEIIQHVESQLLQSDLRDSMLAGTGLPANVAEQINVVLNGPPVLVEIIALTEIGHSAFSLQQVRQNRLEHADLVDLGDDDQEDEGPIPKYPHSMLKMQLSDGTTTVEAIEYRRLPQLNLGETPLGFKVSLSKSETSRRSFVCMHKAACGFSKTKKRSHMPHMLYSFPFVVTCARSRCSLRTSPSAEVSHSLNLGALS